MFERERALYVFTLNYCRLLVEDIEDNDLASQPIANLNHPAWILGHLAIAADHGLSMVGSSRELAKDWYARQGPGSKPVPERSAYPPKEDLWETVAACHMRLDQAAASVTEQALAQPQRGFLPDQFPTVGIMLAHLMTTHPCIHLGQLSAWRRIMSLPSVLGV